MRTRLSWTKGAVTAVGLLACGLATTVACMDYRPRPTPLAQAALSADKPTADAAIAALRAKGPEGLNELMLLMREPARDKRLAAVIDRVAAQKDASYSGLYWYTDVEQAKAAARKQGKPILSLRLLGDLDTDFSCANSRFFRTVLYANGDVSNALRDRFVLHWKSVRPVPKVTIDMGDGRVICRTVTGNSIHYVLDADGRTIDAIPGLYGPGAFLRLLEDAEQLGRDLKARDARGEGEYVRNLTLALWHEKRQSALGAAWEQDLRTVGVAVPTAAGPGTSVPAALGARKGAAAPTALQVAPLTASKLAVEARVVMALDPAARWKAMESSTDDAAWAKIAALPAHAADARLDETSRALVRAKHEGAAAGPRAERAMRLALSKSIQEDPVLRLVNRFERSVAEDTVRNEYGFHRKLHEWFAARLPETTDAAGPDRLNEKVYAELFLTPSSDPWLGLAPEDAYTALEGGGVQ